MVTLKLKKTLLTEGLPVPFSPLSHKIIRSFLRVRNGLKIFITERYTRQVLKDFSYKR